MKDKYLYIVLALYLLVLVKLIVFKYPPGITFSTTNANLIPFKTILGYLTGEPTWKIAMRNLLGNIALLIPFGLLIGAQYQKIKYSRVLLVGLFAGTILELLQVIFRSGILDIDDVILNFLGVVFGYFLFLFFKNIFKQNI